MSCYNNDPDDVLGTSNVMGTSAMNNPNSCGMTSAQALRQCLALLGYMNLRDLCTLLRACQREINCRSCGGGY